MRSISAELAAHFAGHVHTTATLWRIRWKDGTTFGFTDHDQDIRFPQDSSGGMVYASAQGFDASDIEVTCSLEVGNLELRGPLASPSFTRDNLLTGKWDNARIRIEIVNWADLTMGSLVQKVGWLGAVTLERGRFKAQLRDLKDAYRVTVVQLVSPTCRNTLGLVDLKRRTWCSVNLGGSSGSSSFLATGAVEAIDTDGVTIHDSSRTETTHPSGTGYYIGGVVTFTSGANVGLSMEVREYTVGVLQLGTTMYYPIAVGDTYEITPGCPKQLQDCIGTFNNVREFNGEPHLGGNDLLFQQARDT